MNFDDFVNKEWTLFMTFLDKDISFSELVRQRIKLVDECKDALHENDGVKKHE